MKVYPVVVPGGESTQGSVHAWFNAAVKVYNAWSGPEMQFAAVATAPPIRVLTSFAYDQGATPMHERMAAYTPLDDVDLMMDSGAFTVWTMGKAVDLDAYIEWAKERRLLFGQSVVINLDVIPGAPGVKPSDKERKKAIRQSMLNADKIRDAGLPVMEVFHLHDGSFKVMEQLWERRQPGEVLGIGGLAGMGTSKVEMIQFGDGVFARIKDWCGGWDSITKVHGLGISPDAPMARRYPWWSIDSSSWTMFHRFGRDVKRSGGTVQQKSLAPDTRGRGKSEARPVADLYYIRVVKRWRRLEASYSQLWADRGVTFNDERIAA